MLLIRNLTYWFILSTSLILLFPFMLLALPVQGGAHKMAQIWVRILNWSLKHIIGLKYRLIGAENIPDRPSIICAKHQSGWETLALQEIFPPQVYVAKRELFKIPFFGWGLKTRQNHRHSREIGRAPQNVFLLSAYCSLLGNKFGMSLKLGWKSVFQDLKKPMYASIFIGNFLR